MNIGVVAQIVGVVAYVDVGEQIVGVGGYVGVGKVGVGKVDVVEYIIIDVVACPDIIVDVVACSDRDCRCWLVSML